MGKRFDKHKKIFVDFSRDKLQLACLIYGPGHHSDECKVLNEFDNKYNKFSEKKQEVHIIS